MEAAIAANPVIKVAALCGSLRKASFNRGLIRSAIKISKEAINGMEIEYVDIALLPMLNTDLEVDGTYPPAVEAFRQKILEADSILFASPEYNFSVTAPLKNAIDWASRPPNVWADKPAAIISTGGSFGGGRSQYHLRQIGVYLDLHFINKPEFFLNAFQPPAKFDADGNLIDEDAKERIKQVLLSLQAFTRRLQAIGNHDQMNMEDNNIQASTPALPVLGQPVISPSPSLAFMLSSTTSSGANPFQFGTQQNLITPQYPSPFQASNSLDFNAGGSFFLGISNGDNANRRMVKVKNHQRKK